MTWDNTEWNRYVDINDPDGVRWCRLWGESSGESASRCTVTPDLRVGFHTYVADHQTEGSRSGTLCVTEASVIDITSPLEGESIADSAVVAGTASSDLGIDYVEARVRGGPWALAEGTTDWTATVSTDGTVPGPSEIEVRLVRQDCPLATEAIEVTLLDDPILDLGVTRMFAQRQTEIYGTYYDIRWEVTNTGNTPATAVVHLEREDGDGWLDTHYQTVIIEAYDKASGFYESRPMDDGLQWRARVEVTESEADDATLLDHVAYWPARGDGTPQTIVARKAEFDTPDITLTRGSQVAFQWFGADHGVLGPGGQEWCPETSDLGRVCYVVLPGAGRFDYEASDDADINGIVRLPGDPPTFDFPDFGNGTVSGTILFEGSVTSPYGVRQLELRIGSADWFDVDPAEPWSESIDTLEYLNGPLVLAARATGEDDSMSEANVTVTVANPEVPDLVPTNVRSHDGTLTNANAFVTATIGNEGNVATTTDIILLGYLDGAWTEVDRRTITVDPFSDYVQLLRWRCQACIGTYDYMVVADPDGVIEERNEQNNSMAGTVAFRTVST